LVNLLCDNQITDQEAAPALMMNLLSGLETRHYSKQKLIEYVPNKKVVWFVTDSKLNWIEKEKGCQNNFDKEGWN
jgi:hypothetical protein